MQEVFTLAQSPGLVIKPIRPTDAIGGLKELETYIALGASIFPRSLPPHGWGTYHNRMPPEETHIKRLAQQLLAGHLPIDDFVRSLSAPSVADLGEAQIDLDRARRCGFPEVVYGEGKTVEALEKIFRALLAHGTDVLATRVSAEKGDTLAARFPEGTYHPVARTFRIERRPAAEVDPRTAGHVTVVTAGTSDLPVAEEACETLRWMGVHVTLVQDVGVAGPQRLPQRLPDIVGADAVVVVAGMEGALPSVVGGHVDCPVIAVPTSTGYGASLGGMAALLGMLNSCAANVVVVNIDAGFKGGYVAGMIARRLAKARGQ